MRAAPGSEADELHHVVRNHVAQRTGAVEVASAELHPYGFGVGDSDMIDVPAIPNRFENAVAEAEDHDVLHRLFTEVVVDTINLLLREHSLDLFVQCQG